MRNIKWNVKCFGELSAEEVYKILQARTEVFVVEQNCAYQDEDGDDLKALHLWAEEQGSLLAYCRLFQRGIKYPEASIGRVLTTKEGRGRLLGKQMMSYAVQIIETRFRTPAIRISAQDYLLKFYSEFGFEDTGKKYLEDGIPHTEMLRAKASQAQT